MDKGSPNRKNKGERRPQRKCGVTEEPNMDIVIGYNVYSEAERNKRAAQPQMPASPIILLNAEPDLIKEHGLPGFEGVRDSKRVLYRSVAGNSFFHELVKTNANNERLFLICESSEGRLINLYGRDYMVLFVGRDGKEILQIKPSTNNKESAIIIYKNQELGRVVKAGDSSTVYAVQDTYAQTIFELRKSYQYLKNKICCYPRAARKVDNGLGIFSISPGDGPEACVGTIINSEITFLTDVEIIQKTLLFATLICIKTRALDSGAARLLRN